MLKLRDVEVITRGWCLSKQPFTKISNEFEKYSGQFEGTLYHQLVSQFKTYEIAGDFCLLDCNDVIIENKSRDYGVLHQREELFIFAVAVAGTGDVWLMNPYGDVFFLDHDCSRPFSHHTFCQINCSRPFSHHTFCQINHHKIRTFYDGFTTLPS